MKCRMCGKQIKTGTICDKCYKEAMEKNPENNDKKVLLKIVRKFNPRYQLLSNWELLLLCVLILLFAISFKRISYIIFSIVFSFFVIGFSLFISKRIAKGTKCYFMENKVMYKFDFAFIHRKIVYDYSDLDDVVYGYDVFSGYSMFHKLSIRRFLQKKFNMADIVVYAKKTGIIQKNFVVRDVANIEETFEKVINIVGEKLNS